MTSPSYCAPCISDLALVREAVTSVAGTASCMAHAVLLTHGSDDPGRRRQRLEVLKDLANGKAEAAEPAEQVKLELLVQEYGLAGAMDMGGPARRAPQPPRQGGQGGQHQHGQPSAPGEGRKSRRNRPRPGDRPQGQSAGPRPEGGETAPVTPAPGPAGEGAPIEAVTAATEARTETPPAAPQQEAAAAPSALEQTTPAAPQPAPEAPAQPAAPEPAERPAPEQTTPAAPQPAPAEVPPSSAPDA